MRRETLHSENGQSLAEYAVIIAGLAVVVILALFFLGTGIRQIYGSSDIPSTPGPFTPPTHPQASPTTLEQCEDGGWRGYAFESEAACKEYVTGLTP